MKTAEIKEETILWIHFNGKIRISDFIQIKGESQYHPLRMANEVQEMKETDFWR